MPEFLIGPLLLVWFYVGAMSLAKVVLDGIYGDDAPSWWDMITLRAYKGLFKDDDES